MFRGKRASVCRYWSRLPAERLKTLKKEYTVVKELSDQGLSAAAEGEDDDLACGSEAEGNKPAETGSDEE